MRAQKKPYEPDTLGELTTTGINVLNSAAVIREINVLVSRFDLSRMHAGIHAYVYACMVLHSKSKAKH